jgi:hypothetical protein
MTALDTNSDGVLSTKEIENIGSVLQRLDKNHDGKLTRDELRLSDQQPRGQGQRGRGQPGGEQRGGEQRGGGQRGGGGGNLLFRALDTDGDGELSAVEIRNAVAALKKLDENNDNQLTRDELRPADGRGGPTGQGGPRQGGRGQGGERRRPEGEQQGTGRPQKPTE